jgi:hypothetical protein
VYPASSCHKKWLKKIGVEMVVLLEAIRRGFDPAPQPQGIGQKHAPASIKFF